MQEPFIGGTDCVMFFVANVCVFCYNPVQGWTKEGKPHKQIGLFYKTEKETKVGARRKREKDWLTATGLYIVGRAGELNLPDDPSGSCRERPDQKHSNLQ